MKYFVLSAFAVMFLVACKKAELTLDANTLSVQRSFIVDSASPVYVPAINETHVDLETAISINIGVLAGIGTQISTLSFSVTHGGEKVAGDVIVQEASVLFRPADDLLPNTQYSVTFAAMKEYVIDRNRQIVHDVPLGYHWDFTTGGATSYAMTKRSDAVTQFARDGLQTMQVGNSLFTYGGWQRVPESYNDVYMSDGDLTTWTKMPDAPWHRRHTFGIGKIDSTLYIFGGDAIRDTFDVWKSVDGINFSEVAPSLDGTVGNRILYGACTHNNRLFVLGGQAQVDTGYGLTDVWSSSDGANWEKLSDGNTFLAGNIAGSVASFNGQIWVVGGGYYEDPDPDKLYTAQIYSSPDGVSWTRHADGLWSGRQYTNIVAWNNRLWMVGGFDWDNLDDIWYMKKDGTWEQFTPPAGYEGRHASGVTIYKDKLVIVCGNYHNDCWVIEKVKS